MKVLLGLVLNAYIISKVSLFKIVKDVSVGISLAKLPGCRNPPFLFLFA